MSRVHSFQFHIEVSFSSLEDMEFLDSKIVQVISDYFETEVPDIPDIIVKLEIIALEDGYYGAFLRDFIAEEFKIHVEYSFSVIAVLNYIKTFNITVEEALCDIFKVSSK